VLLLFLPNAAYRKIAYAARFQAAEAVAAAAWLAEITSISMMRQLRFMPFVEKKSKTTEVFLIQLFCNAVAVTVTGRTS
jgi:hypothetical protein